MFPDFGQNEMYANLIKEGKTPEEASREMWLTPKHLIFFLVIDIIVVLICYHFGFLPL